MLLGLSEAEVRKQLADLYFFIVEFSKGIQRTQIVTSTAMFYLHKYFKQHSFLSHSSSPSPTNIAASCVFLASKVCYSPIHLHVAVKVFFDIEKKMTPSLRSSSLSLDREFYYRDLFEKAEFLLLETLGFELECELPYKVLSDFCYKHLPLTSRDSILELAVKFCNDSFKLPLCLFFHPKVIAAACIHSAALWRKNKGLECGLPLEI